MIKKNSTINDRISYIIENKYNGNKKKFSDTVGCAPQVIHNIVSGRKSKPSYTVLNAIMTSFVYINAEWLLTGKGEMLKEEQVPSQKIMVDERPIIEITPEAGKPNTFIADVQASAGFGSLLEHPRKLERLPAVRLPNAPYGLNVAFQIQGDSMHNTIRNGDYVAANQLNDASDIRDGYTYVIVDKRDGVLCKRLYYEGDRFKIISDNPHYPPYYRSPKDILAYFKCFMRMSTDFRSYHDDVRKDIQDLRIRVDSLERKISR